MTAWTLEKAQRWTVTGKSMNLTQTNILMYKLYYNVQCKLDNVVCRMIRIIETKRSLSMIKPYHNILRMKQQYRLENGV